MRNDDPHVKRKNIIKNDGNSLYEIPNNKHVDLFFYDKLLVLKNTLVFYRVIFLTFFYEN